MKNFVKRHKTSLLIAVAVIVLALLSSFLTLGHASFYPPDAAPLAQLESMQGSFATVVGHKIHYRKEGHGPPVILIHGFGAWSYSWRGNIGPLSKQFTVYAIDLLGFGLSDKPKSGRYSVPDQADLVAHFMDKMGLEKVHIIGNSLGGEIALHLALTHPDKIDSLVLIDSAGFRERPKIPNWVSESLLRGALSTVVLNRIQVERTLRIAYHNDNLISKRLIDAYYLPLTKEGAANAFSAMAKQLVIGKQAEDIYRIKAPTLIIWGKSDRVIPVKDAFKFHEAIRGSKLSIINNTGHAPHEEEPEKANELIESFLSEHNERLE